MRGVGWVILFEDPVDVWEHAYMRDYPATERQKYVDAFFRNIDWARVEHRLGEAAAVRPAAA